MQRLQSYCSSCAHQSSGMHIMQLFKSFFGVILEQTPRQLSILYIMISPLGEMLCNGIS